MPTGLLGDKLPNLVQFNQINNVLLLLLLLFLTVWG